MSNKEVCILILKKYLKEIKEDCYIPICGKEIEIYLIDKKLSKQCFFDILKDLGVDVVMKNKYEASDGYSNYTVNYLIRMEENASYPYYLRNSPSRINADSLESGKYNSKIFISLIKLYFSSGFNYNDYINLYKDLSDIIKEET